MSITRFFIADLMRKRPINKARYRKDRVPPENFLLPKHLQAVRNVSLVFARMEDHPTARAQTNFGDCAKHPLSQTPIETLATQSLLPKVFALSMYQTSGFRATDTFAFSPVLPQKDCSQSIAVGKHGP